MNANKSVSNVPKKYPKFMKGTVNTFNINENCKFETFVIREENRRTLKMLHNLIVVKQTF